MLLSGKISVITGASMGIGKTIAAAFVKEGSNCILSARGEKALVATAEKLATGGSQVRALPADVSRERDVSALIDFAFSEFGRIDILVNCAGVLGPIGLSTEVDPREWWKTLEINVRGTFLCSRAVLQVMIRQGTRGKIINLSGGGAASPFPNFSAYAASKAAVVRLTETLAVEVRQYGIDINVIAPGAVNTRLLDQVLDAGEAAGPEQTQRALKQKEEGGASPELAAELAVFLASSRSDGLTGKFLSAVWDDWRTMSGHVSEFMDSDVYTLRRVTPEQA